MPADVEESFAFKDKVSDILGWVEGDTLCQLKTSKPVKF